MSDYSLWNGAQLSVLREAWPNRVGSCGKFDSAIAERIGKTPRSVTRMRERQGMHAHRRIRSPVWSQRQIEDLEVAWAFRTAGDFDQEQAVRTGRTVGDIERKRRREGMC